MDCPWSLDTPRELIGMATKNHDSAASCSDSGPEIAPRRPWKREMWCKRRLWMLQLEWNSIPLQLMSQALFVAGFQQPRPQFAMNFDRTADHAPREIVEFHPSCSSCTSW